MKPRLFLISFIFLFVFSEKLEAYKVNWTRVKKDFVDHLSAPDINVKNARIEIYNFQSKLVYQYELGSFSREQRIPIMSGSKWIAAAVVMSLVDDGILDLDTPIQRYLDPDWITVDSDFQTTMIHIALTRVTIRNLLALTSPVPSHHECISSSKVSMNQCTGLILKNLLDEKKAYSADLSFSYGDTYYTILGSIAERATGMPFSALFHERVARPIGIEQPIQFFAKPRKKKGVENPRPAAGALMSVAEYERFMRLLSNKGRFNGKQVLKRDTVKSMSADQVSFIRRRSGSLLPYGRPRGFRTYGFGNFVSCLDTFCRRRVNSSPGLNGFTPFIDFDRGYYVIIGVFKNDPKMSEKMRPLQDRLMNYLSESTSF